ncbi:MAG: carbohydrate binding family 9 domain-containing protein [Bacteroidetes bacterium]|nr:carbohydrate binding family 9 domain-containing protein [Bacteroidota bacterium]
MKFCILIFCYLSLPLCLLAQTQKTFAIQSVEFAPKVDGDLSDEVWKTCITASNFTQTIPEQDQPSKFESDVRMCYTNKALYVSAIMYEPEMVCSRQVTARDMLNNVNADVFAIFLDTYNDHQNGFVFKVSSGGAQHDERLSNGFENGDQSWDAVWTSKIGCFSDHWQVEMEIPFSALRFTKSDTMIWGINFFRSVRKLNENSYWNKIDPQKQGFLAQTGTLLGLKNIKPPKRLFLYPYLSTGFLQQEVNGKVKPSWLKSGGMDIKYGLNESFTLDVTLIPDFSQVVSDNLVRNLSPFEQQLAENRPFFTEGTEMFNKADVFYSRRVGGRPSGFYQIQSNFGDTSQYDIEKNPNVSRLYNAFKISGRNKNKTGIGVFNAVGAPSYAHITDKQSGEKYRIETEPLTNYNVLVYDKVFRGQSNFNFTNTNVIRNGNARDANVSSCILDKFSKNENYALKLISKWSVVQNQKDEIGSAVGIVFSKITGKFNYRLIADRLSPKFDKSDMGIQFDYNNSTQRIALSYQENKPKSKHLQLYRLSTDHAVAENTVPFEFKYYEAKVGCFLLFKSFWDITLSTESKPFAPIDFYQLGAWGKKLKTLPYFYNALNGSSDSRKKLFWAYYGGYGISNMKHSDYLYLNQSLRYRFSSKLDISIGGEVTRDNSAIGFAYYDNSLNEPIAGRRDVREYSGEINVKYNLNPNTNLTARFRHYNSFITYTSFHLVEENGEWKNQTLPYQNGYNENFNLQNIDIFFNWMFKPGSRLVVSYKQWLNDAYLLNQKNENSYFHNVGQLVSKPHAFELALRVIYFLDYNQLKG